MALTEQGKTFLFVKQFICFKYIKTVLNLSAVKVIIIFKNNKKYNPATRICNKIYYSQKNVAKIILNVKSLI